MTILQKVKIEFTIRKIDSIPEDEVLEYLIEQVIQSTLNYCNIYRLPRELESVVAKMVADSYQEAQDGGNMLIGGTGKVSSVSEGGRTVNFDVSQKAVAIASLAEQRLTSLKELDKFKQLYKFPTPEEVQN